MKFLQCPIFFVLFEFVCSLAYSQTTAIPATLRATMTMNRISSLQGGSGSILYGIPMSPGKLIGDSYMSKTWNYGSILLYELDKLIEGYPLRYDIDKDELEISAPGGAKALAGNKVKSFSWQDSLSHKIVYFINAKDYTSTEGTSLTGFFEVLSDGSIPVFKRTNLVLKKANYVKEFDTGTRDDQILKKEEFFYIQEGKVHPLPTSKKKLLPLFNEQADKMKSYIEMNNMSLKEAHHIQSIFDHYNSLIKS